MIKKHIKSNPIGEKRRWPESWQDSNINLFLQSIIYTLKTCYFVCVCAAWVKVISYFPRHVFGGHILKAHSSGVVVGPTVNVITDSDLVFKFLCLGIYKKTLRFVEKNSLFDCEKKININIRSPDQKPKWSRLTDKRRYSKLEPNVCLIGRGQRVWRPISQ